MYTQTTLEKRVWWAELIICRAEPGVFSAKELGAWVTLSQDFKQRVFSSLEPFSLSAQEGKHSTAHF